MKKMPEITEEMINNVIAKMTEVSGLLKGCPTPEDIKKMGALSKEFEGKIAGIEKGEGLAEIVKAAVAEAIKPLQERIEELEGAPLIKGFQDFDVQKLKKEGIVKERDIVGDVLKCAFPEIRGDE